VAEIIQKDGTWVFDGDALRLTPGRDGSVGSLRRELGELVVPLGALASVSVERGKKSGWLRLRLREGADPLLQATGGRLGEADDPYRLTVRPDRYGVAEYFADEVRNALLLEGVSAEPVSGYLLPGPPLPVSASAGDGSAHFDGERVRLEWNWKMSASGRVRVPVSALTSSVHRGPPGPATSRPPHGERHCRSRAPHRSGGPPRTPMTRCCAGCGSWASRAVTGC